jgi:uncharacterized protein YggU (UPF0235/DUF167 family)
LHLKNHVARFLITKLLEICDYIEKARENEANVRVLLIIRQLFKEARGVRIIKGQKTPNKIIEVLEPTLPLI